MSPIRAGSARDAQDGPAALGPCAQAGLYGAAFFAITAEALISMLLPLWALERGFGAERLGVLVALGSIAPMALAPGVGALCDRYGDRRVLIATAAGTCVSALLYAPAPGYFAACAVQLLGGLTRSTSWVAAQSYAVRRVPEAQRARVMGRFSFAGSAGMLVAPLLAGYLVAHGGVRAGFWLLAAWGAGLVLVGLALPGQQLGRGHGSVVRVTVAGYARMLPLLAQPVLAVIMALTLIRLGAAAVNASFYPVHLAYAGLGSAAIGAMFAAINGAVSVGSLAAAWISRRSGVGPLLVGAVALAIVAICAVPLTTRPWLIAVLSVLHGLGLGLSLPTLLTAIGTATPVHERGRVIGLRTVFNRLGYLVVPVGLGFLAARFGLAPAFLATGALLVLLLAVTVWGARRFGVKLSD